MDALCDKLATVVGQSKSTKLATIEKKTEISAKFRVRDKLADGTTAIFGYTQSPFQHTDG